MPDGSTNAPREKKNPLSGSPKMVEKSEPTVGEQSRIGGTPTPNEGSGMTSSFHFPSEGACHQELYCLFINTELSHPFEDLSAKITYLVCAIMEKN